MAVSFIGGGNRRTWRKQPTCVKKGKIYAGYEIRNTSRMHMNVFKYFECELKRTKNILNIVFNPK